MTETEHARAGCRGLYAAWERVRDAADPDREALADLRSRRRWTFAEIQAEVEARPRRSAGELWTPAGFDIDLVFATLCAWRDGALLCPVEKAGAEPPSSAFAGLPADTVHVKVTSGSTGLPRLVRFRGPDLAADAGKIVATMGLRPEWPNLGVVSMAHSYGFSSLVLPLLLHGIPLAWLGDPMPAAVGTALKEFPGNRWTLPAVPAMWRAWLAAGILDEERVPLAISAGAPLPVEIERAVFDSTGVKIHNFLGSSECGGIAYDRSDVPRESSESVGTAMEETELVVNADGCLEVRSPSVAAGYWPEEEDETGSAIRGGAFVTSDLAEIDSSGEVRLAGRRDDLINVAGRKVSPARVEAALSRHPDAGCVLAFGIPSPDAARGDEIVAAFSGGGAVTAQAMREVAAHSLAVHEMPRHWWCCPDLAPDVRGKLSRSRWRQRFLAERKAGSQEG